jgi:hypothetical protein
VAQKAIGINIPASAEPNFDADDFAALFHALAGAEGILGFGITCTIIDNNTVRINGCDVLVQGRQHRVVGGTTQDLAVANGTIGYERSDLVVAEFERRASTEDSDVLQFAVVQGTPFAPPTFDTGGHKRSHQHDATNTPVSSYNFRYRFNKRCASRAQYREQNRVDTDNRRMPIR